MVEAKVSARCSQCGKPYRVPAGDRTYSCKHCGGAVRAAPDERGDEPGRACPQCRTPRAGEDAFCSECGASFERGGHADLRHGAARQRRRATGELARVLKTIKVMRWLYGASAVLAAIATALIALAMASPEVPAGPALLLLFISSTSAAIALVAVMQLPFQPFLWSVLLAGWVTMTQVARLVQGDAPVLGWAWVAVLWLLVVPTVRARKLVRENPDLYVVHRLHGTQELRQDARRAGHDSRRDMATILARARSTARRRSTLAALLVYALTALGAGSVYARLRPGSVDAALESLRSAWAEADTAAIAGLFASEHRSWQSQQLQRVFMARGWERAAPALGAHEVGDAGGRTRVVLECSAGDVVADWEWSGGRWVLRGLELPPPPLDPWVERFADAWRAADAAGLAGLFAEDSREKMAASLRSLLARREWTGQTPALRSWEGDLLDRGRAEVRFELDEGRLITRWALRDGVEWSLTSIRPPRD